jgi:hypothetical protein
MAQNHGISENLNLDEFTKENGITSQPPESLQMTQPNQISQLKYPIKEFIYDKVDNEKRIKLLKLVRNNQLIKLKLHIKNIYIK